jgi:hypothetical protein
MGKSETFSSNLVTKNSLNMKKLLVLVVLLSSFQLANAQRGGAFRFQMDLGGAIPKEGGIGALVNIEPQILLSDNLAFGLRMGVAGLAKDVVYYNISTDFEGEISANASLTGTLNYYFNQGKSRITPYLGAGFGYYALSSVQIDDSDIDYETGSLEANFAWAPMVRAGLELGKFRIGAEYNIVPPSDLQNVSGQVIGEAINQYYGITLGFFVGGGKWGK